MKKILKVSDSLKLRFTPRTVNMAHMSHPMTSTPLYMLNRTAVYTRVLEGRGGGGRDLSPLRYRDP